MREIEQSDLTAIYDKLAAVASPTTPQAFLCGLHKTPGVVGEMYPMPDVLLEVAFENTEAKAMLNRMAIKLITDGHYNHFRATAICGFEPRLAAFVYPAFTEEIPGTRQQELLIELVTEHQSYLGRMPIVNGKPEYRPLDFQTIGRWNTVH